MLFKPSNYQDWMVSSINKILTTVDSCKTEGHIATCQVMIDNFIMVMILNDDYTDEDSTFISRQLYLYMQIKNSNLYASNER